MDAPKLNKLDMYQSVAAVLTKPEYRVLWENVPGFVRLQTRFASSLEQINQNSGKQGRRKTGVAGDKEAARKAMCKKALVVAGSVAAYAYHVENHELLTRADTTLSILMGGRGKDSRDKCADILAAGTANLPVLDEFALSQADIDELKALIEEYDDLAPQPRLVKTQMKGAGQVIDIAFDQADGILNNGLDNLMLKYEELQPAFFRDYMNARIIIDRPGGHGNGQNEKPEPENPTTPK